jgi:hypothetical protein
MTTTTTTTETTATFNLDTWVPVKGEAVYLTEHWSAHGVCAEITGVRYLEGAGDWKVSFKYRHEETGEVVKETQRIDAWRMRKGADKYCEWFVPVAHASLAHKVAFAKAVQGRAEARARMAKERAEHEVMYKAMQEKHAELLERMDIGSVECKVPTNRWGNRFKNNMPIHRRERVFAITLTRRGIGGYHKSLRIREYHDSLLVRVMRESGVGSWKVDFSSASESSWIGDTHKMQTMLLSLMTTAASWCEMKNREERDAVAKVRAMREAVAA